jgi:hypothetical protein
MGLGDYPWALLREERLDLPHLLLLLLQLTRLLSVMLLRLLKLILQVVLELR